MADQWLSIVEYARTFGISDMTIRRRIRTGKLEAQLRDGKYYIPIGAQASVPGSSKSILKTRNLSNGPTTSNQLGQNQRSIMASHRSSSEPIHQHHGFARELSANNNFRQSSEYEQNQSHFETKIDSAGNEYFNNVGLAEASRNSRSWTDESPRLEPQSFRKQIDVVKPTNSSAYINADSFAEFPRSMIQELNHSANETREMATKILSFAKNSIQQAKELEQTQINLSETKNQVLLERLAQKDQTIFSLRQQIEDLQLLVQILEKKKA